MKLYARDTFTREKLSEIGLSFDEIYEELPIEIVNTGLLKALIWELEDDVSLKPSYAAFDLSSNAFLEKNLSMLLDSVSDLQLEQGKVQTYQRLVARQTTLQQSLLQKRVRHIDLISSYRPSSAFLLTQLCLSFTRNAESRKHSAQALWTACSSRNS
jgi:hypothetical protein